MQPTLTLGEWYEDFFLRLFHSDARPATVREYRCTLRMWAKHSKNLPLQEIDQMELASFIASLKCGKATAAKHCRQLNHLLTKAGQPGPRNRDAIGMLEVAPWFRPPRSEIRLPLVPIDSDVHRFVERAPIDLALFAVLAATTGSRQGAIRSLTDEAVDLTNGVVRFPAHSDKKHQERIKPIGSIACAWWRELGSERKHWKVETSSFCRRWKRHAKKAGTPGLRPHGLKRWWAAQLIRAGASPWAVKYALDHAQRDVTGIHYLAPFDELSRLVIEIDLPLSFQHRLNSHLTEKKKNAIQV